MGERCRWCGTCGRVLASKSYYPATLRSLFGDVPVQVRRLLVCPCQSAEGVKSFAVLDLAAATVAPELAYVTARYAALLPFGKAASLLTELLPTRRGGERGHGAKQDDADRPRCRAATSHLDGAADRAAASRSRRGWA